MTTDIKPTRSELIKINNQIKLAKSGHSLLKKKRDGLILEFFEILKSAKTVRNGLAKQYEESQKKLNIARTMYTDLRIRSLAFAIQETPEINVETKNIMGVKVPKIESKQVTKTLEQRKLGISGSTAVIDDTIGSYEVLVEIILKVAEIETTMKKLLNEIEKTKRRVNALEFNVIPKLTSQKKFIKLRLEEMERENIFRLKRVKAKA
jgi:V/A-type H+/Na+-transporting ATPase subunit D